MEDLKIVFFYLYGNRKPIKIIFKYSFRRTCISTKVICLKIAILRKKIYSISYSWLKKSSYNEGNEWRERFAEVIFLVDREGMRDASVTAGAGGRNVAVVRSARWWQGNGPALSSCHYLYAAALTRGGSDQSGIRRTRIVGHQTTQKTGADCVCYQSSEPLSDLVCLWSAGDERIMRF